LSEWKHKLILSLRGLQVISIGFAVTGFIWATSDLLLKTVLVEAPVTPLSVLFMLYGTVGTVVIEGIIRVLERQARKGNFLRGKQENG